jgi:hypothetical protein
MTRLDGYTWKARVAPAALAALPMLTFVAFVADTPAVGTLVPAAGAAAVLLAAAEWVRSRGVTTEARLKQKWNGLPTTRALRSGGDYPELRETRRAAVARLAGMTLPSPVDDETRGADARYETAVRATISAVRENESDSRLLAAENSSYGFRRNMRGVRPWALGLLTLCTVCHVWVMSAVNTTNAWLLAVDVLLFLYWGLVVRDAWVREQADKFSERFFLVAGAAAKKVLASPSDDRPSSHTA